MKSLVIRYIVYLFGVAGILEILFCQFHLRTLDLLIHIFGGIFSFLLLSCMVNFIRAIRMMATKSDKWQKFRKVFAIHILLTIFFAFQVIFIGTIMDYKARAEIRNWLNQIDEKNAIVKIDGVQAHNPKIVIEALRGLRLILHTRSRSINEVKCEIFDGDNKLDLMISQNSTQINQYWVLYPKYRFTKLNSIGGFFSDSIDFQNP